MEKIILNYFSLDDNEPSVLHFSSVTEMYYGVVELRAGVEYDHTVYLITDADGLYNEIFITDCFFMVDDIFHKILTVKKNAPTVVFFQEYYTWQDAYKVALSMRENRINCYNKEQ